jgi:hypothetical protein
MTTFEADKEFSRAPAPFGGLHYQIEFALRMGMEREGSTAAIINHKPRVRVRATTA